MTESEQRQSMRASIVRVASIPMSRLCRPRVCAFLAYEARIPRYSERLLLTIAWNVTLESFLKSWVPFLRRTALYVKEARLRTQRLHRITPRVWIVNRGRSQKAWAQTIAPSVDRANIQPCLPPQTKQTAGCVWLGRTLPILPLDQTFLACRACLELSRKRPAQTILRPARIAKRENSRRTLHPHSALLALRAHIPRPWLPTAQISACRVHWGHTLQIPLNRRRRPVLIAKKASIQRPKLRPRQTCV